MTVGEFLQSAQQRLTDAGIVTARLDAQLLLSDALECDKSWLLAHPEQRLASKIVAALERQVKDRVAYQPLAYIRGYQEFYGRRFIVTPDVLIPRPETEGIIAWLKDRQPRRLLDVGTGSGAIAITAALELPHSQVDACDISARALSIAAKNADALHANVHFFRSDLLQQVHGHYDAIVANLPYVDPTWHRSPETAHEPSVALFAGDRGLELIKKLLDQAPPHLAPGGFVVLEADPRQHAAIIKYVTDNFTHLQADGFIVSFQVRPRMSAASTSPR